MKLLALLALLPGFALAAPDESVLGKAEGYPVCRALEPRCMVGRYSHMDELFPARKVAKGAAVRELKRTPSSPDVGLDAYLDHNRNTGLLLLQGDTVLAERYQYERNAQHRFASASMAKTLLAMLVGIAVSEKRISSIDDPVSRYVPGLAGHPFGEASLRHLLTMSSGMQFRETYDGKDEGTQLVRLSLGGQSEGGSATVRPFATREQRAGERFKYSSADSQVLGLALRGAVGKPLTEYLSEKIWQPMGAESDASWLVDKGGYEIAYCCFNATLRDYARVGLLLANQGALDGKQIVPAEWVRAMTRPDAPHLEVGRATPNNGYGYQTWLIHRTEPRFALLGIWGQGVFVDPKHKVVLVHTAVHRAPSDRDARRAQFQLWDSVLAKLSQ